MAGNTIWSGEPLPLAPKVENAELSAFHRKLIDYLRRLAAKLNQYVDPGGGGQGGGAVEVIGCYNTANKSIGPAYTAIDWNLELRKDDPPFTHDNVTDPSRIGVSLDGYYLVLCDLEIGSGATFPAEAFLEILSPAAGSVRFSFGSISGPGTISLGIGLPLVAGIVFEIRAKDSSAGAGDNVLSRGSRVNVLRLRDTSTGWDPSLPGGLATWVIAEM